MSILIGKKSKGPERRQTAWPHSFTEEGDTWYRNDVERYGTYTTADSWSPRGIQPGTVGSNHGYLAGTQTLDYVIKFNFPIGGSCDVVGYTASWAGIERRGAGFNSSIKGYHTAQPLSPGPHNVYELLFPFNAGTSALYGPLTQAPYWCHAFNMSTAGFVCEMDSLTWGGADAKRVEQVTFSFVMTPLKTTHNLADRQYTYSGGCNSSSAGYLFGGGIPPTFATQYERFWFPSQTFPMVLVGSIAAPRYGHCNFNSSTHGFMVGGIDAGAAYRATSEHMVFSNDSAISIENSQLTKNRRQAKSFNSTVQGYSCGGRNAGSLADYEAHLFPFLSASSIVEGSLPGVGVSEYDDVGAGIDGVDFVTQFV